MCYNAIYLIALEEEAMLRELLDNSARVVFDTV